jgi:predicted ATPase
MTQEIRLPLPVRLNRRGTFHEINAVTSPLVFDPHPNEFFEQRAQSPITILAGRNNVGKSLLLRLLKAQDTERAIMLATDRFYQLHYLTLGDNPDQELFTQYTNFYSTFESPENNDKSNIQLHTLLQALSQEQFDKLSALFKELLGFDLRVRASYENRPLSNKYIEIGGTPLQASSTGTRLLLLILAVCTDSRTDALYIDEPELGLSPQLQRVIAAMLFDSTARRQRFPHLKKVVLTTHSPLMLDRSVLGNNFMLSRSDANVTITSPGTVADLHSLRFAMLGDSLEALFLPEVIVVVEGKTDHAYLDALLKQRFPDSRLTVVPAGDDSQMEKLLYSLEACIGPLRDSPLSPRIWCVLDQRHRAGLRQALASRGVPADNIVTWKNNGIEYVYPDRLLMDAFRTEEGVADRLQIKSDSVQVGSIELRKAELADFVSSRLTAATIFPTELVTKLLAPLDVVLARNKANSAEPV